MITDGYVGEPKRDLADRVRRARVDLRVVLTPDGWTKDLAPLASRLVTLPPLALTDAPARRSA